MNEDRKKYLRTQGKYSDMGKNKSQDTRKKSSPGVREPPEKKINKRYSNESRRSNSSRSTNSFGDDVSPVKYEENSDYYFEKLEESRKLIEITDPGKTVLSTTDNGDSVIFYEPQLLNESEADEFYERLHSSTSWYSKNIVINGEEKPQPRLVAWFGPYPYSYSGATLEPAEMPDSVLEIKKKVEEYLNKEFNIKTSFNSVLLNLYRNNKDSVAWHSDDELTMGICPVIASVSLGENRRFEMRPKKKYVENEKCIEKQDHYFIQLTHGSLVVMDGCMQDDWQHRVPKEYHDKDPRINLTFRTVYPLEKISHRVPREFKKRQVDDWYTNKSSNSKINFDEDFPPLSSDVNIPSSSPYSGVRSDSFNSSNSSVRNTELNQSSENWDSEASFNENIKNENDIKYSENISDGIDNSYESNSVESYVKDSVSPTDITEEYISSKKSPKKWLNVAAKEFIPKNPLPFSGPDYSKFPLEELLYYEVKLMCIEKLNDFSSNLKVKIQERLDEFSQPVREELEFLCLLIDGSQTEKNQRLISSRIVDTVSKYLKRHKVSPDFQISYDRHSRTPSYGRQNNFDRRRYNQNQGKGNIRRFY